MDFLAAMMMVCVLEVTPVDFDTATHASGLRLNA